jgi:trimethylamine monooxygenase
MVNNKDTIEQFDYIIVATGHYSYPNLPDFKGIELFKGKIAHCHELREFNEFKNLNVLVIGGSYSAEDVTLQCYKYGAKRIIWGYRKMKMNYNMTDIPKNIEVIPGLSHFD